ncbi:hypothetical protein SAMN04488595_107119 [Ralstonia sp. 25mfcol4.1]|uniref:hypothetical protein n=1 Tax=Burkholderiaceae TaxID=119060 RepID=UPI00088EE7A6|nr:hypothetical protein [Ralstonia sp. 25mfcol4.1]SDP32464.1 hypothetical protein SAMN04488595_107119 [Ralstonia sp. 25mfcol4.1]
MKIATTQRALVALAGAWIVSLALAGCGGGDGGSSAAGSNAGNAGNGSTGSGGGGTGGTGSNGGTGGTGDGGGSVTPAAVTYLGVISFGDTIAITLDAPAAGKLKIRFADSAFGLSGTLIGDYTNNGGVYTVANLAADGADPPPAFVSALLGSITATFTVSGTTLTGEIAGLPKQLGGGKLSGHISASSVSAGSTPASLAGTYSLITTQSTYYATSGNLQGQNGIGSQMRVNADGSVRMCQADYSDTCVNGLPGSLTLADQTRYPGAYELTLGGQFQGRLFTLQTNGGIQTLYLDMIYPNNMGNPITGTAIFRPVQTLTAAQVAGRWTCSQPAVSYLRPAGLGLPVYLDGAMQSNVFTISADGEVTDMATHTATPLHTNVARNSVGGIAQLTAINGIMSTEWTVPVGTVGTRSQVFLPLDATTMAYFAEIQVPIVDTNVTVAALVQGKCSKSG